ncbi:hypothetical protein V6U78_02160 [Marinospirillum sp. MEB164]|uniref:Uncharacterized protein n=1 Tax=Marinospirillum alkalitolerans TaxID=3123374 RepID=A0ABW8PU76_9GAMM
MMQIPRHLPAPTAIRPQARRPARSLTPSIEAPQASTASLAGEYLAASESAPNWEDAHLHTRKALMLYWAVAHGGQRPSQIDLYI